MRRVILLTTLLLASTLCSAESLSAAEGPVAWWKFESVEETPQGATVARFAIDSSSQRRDRITGHFKIVAGSSGRGFKFDGFSTSLTREASRAPRLGDAFTIEAWVAIGAYPWNWCPIVAQERDASKGFYFGLDSQGRLGLRAAVDGKWVECNSETDPDTRVDLNLRTWYHVAAVFDSRSAMTIYKNGKPVATVPVNGRVDFAPEINLLIGRNNRPLPPTHPVRTWATYPSWYSFDGIIDEIKMYAQARSQKQIAQAHQTSQPRGLPDISPRRFPTVSSTGHFGAYYTRLKYYEEWDALWRTGDHSDIVVQFDEHPVKVMFWRGSRYSPCWVTENGKWMADQSREVGENWNAPLPREKVPTGCCEHMSDAQCRYSHVRIIESNDARVVVHWRYALLDVLYRQAGVSKETGWGLWGDEMYTIYPDGAGVRKLLPGRGGWQETIFFNEPGTRPEDNVELEALTLVNLKGESRSYSWEHGYPVLDLPEPIMQMTNMKSKYRPFMIFRPGSEMETFNVEVRPEYSHFPWWNHWPVAQVISDGRHSQAADRAAHSSLAWGGPVGAAALYGMTDRPAVELLPLARSWISPPNLKGVSESFTSEGYDYSQRAYVITRKQTGQALDVEMAANEDSPVFNPAFVVQNWGRAGATLKVDGKEIERGNSFRLGHRHTLKGTDLIVWVKIESMETVRMTLAPVLPTD